MGVGLSLVPIECARQELDARLVTLVPVQVRLPTNACVMTYPVGQIEPVLAAFINVMRVLASTEAQRALHRCSQARSGD
jgi:DNA-binding transcriptional LysR family regulator